MNVVFVFEGFFWIGSSISHGTLNEPFTLTCNTSSNSLIQWQEYNDDGDRIQPAVIDGIYSNGSCKFDPPGPLLGYTFTCDPTTGIYTMKILGTLMTDAFHNKQWRCQDLFGGGTSNTYVLRINIPVTTLTLSPTTSNGEVKINETEIKIFTCSTNEIRPNASIEWYLDTVDVTNQGIPKTEIVNTDKVISSSELQYTGNKNDHMKNVYCTAINLQGLNPVQSEVVIIYIQYGPRTVTLSPNTTSYTVTEDGNINQITCSADCNPTCTMTWTGPNLPQGTTSILNLQNIDRNQAGNYQCTARNIIRSQTSVIVNVVVNYGPPTVTISPATQSYTVTENGTIYQIICSADCNPTCTMTWTGPNLPQGTTSILNLQYIDRDQAGSYHCTARNDIGSRTSVTVNVVVNYGPGTVTISPATLSYTVTENGNINQITCSANCNPTCNMTWNGPNLPQGAKSVLHLQNIDRNQTGSYHCTARNDIGSQTSVTVNVVVDYGPRTVTISPVTQSYNVTENGHIDQITCSADCNPNCTMTWTGPNLPPDTTSILNLQNIDRNQAGSYHCKARNDIGSQTSVTVNIVVNYGPSDVKLSVTRLDFNVNETEGQIGPINCSAECQPACTIQWKGPNNFQQQTILNLSNIKRTSTGNYSCTAYNFISNETSESVRVTVNYKPDVTSLLGNGTVNENETVVLQCHINSYPLMLISWTQDTVPIQPGGNIRIENTTIFDVHNSKLTINKVSCIMMGEYRCQAMNILGIGGGSVNLSVMCYPRVEDTVPTEVPIGDNENINITTPVIGYPKPSFFWTFRQNATTKNITEGTSNYFGVNKHFANLFIGQPSGDNFGFYEIYGHNSVNGTRLLHIYKVNAARKPNPPELLACQADIDFVTVVWQSGFNGGGEQKFTVYYKFYNSKDGLVAFGPAYDDLGPRTNHTADITRLQSETSYVFLVKANNIHGDTNSSRTVVCNTTAKVNVHNGGSPLALVGGLIGSAAAVVILLAIGLAVFILRKRRNIPKDKEKKLITRKSAQEDDDEDGLKDNILYESAGPGYSKEQKKVGVEYAVVQKKGNRFETEATQETSLYTEVKKKPKHGNRGEVYANVTPAKKDKSRANEKKSNQEDVYENMEGKINNGTSTNHVQKKKHKDGLHYADLVFNPTPKGAKFVIHGLEDRTIYAEVDTTQKIDPLPDSDDEDTDKSANPTSMETSNGTD